MAAVVLGGVHGGVGKTVLAEALVEALRYARVLAAGLSCGQAVSCYADLTSHCASSTTNGNMEFYSCRSEGCRVSSYTVGPGEPHM